VRSVCSLILVVALLLTAPALAGGSSDSIPFTVPVVLQIPAAVRGQLAIAVKCTVKDPAGNVLGSAQSAPLTFTNPGQVSIPVLVSMALPHAPPAKYVCTLVAGPAGSTPTAEAEPYLVNTAGLLRGYQLSGSMPDYVGAPITP
jgi:hypothetical protein